MPNYIKTGTDEAGQKVGMLPDGTIEVIGPTKAATPQKPSAEITRMNIGLEALGRTLDEYDQLVKDFNPRNPLQQVDPNMRARAEALSARAQLEAKEGTALGALTGPDVQILGKILSNPATLKGAYYGTEGLKEQINQGRQLVNVRKQALASMGLPTGAPVSQPPATAGKPPNSASASGEVRRRRYNLETGLFE